MDMKQFTSLNPVADLPRFAALLGLPERPKNAFGQKQGANTGWYRIKNLSETDAEVFIYSEIGEFGGITADDFVREFSEIKASRITVRINSRGGVVWDAFPIFNAIRRHPAHVTTIVDGIAASSASFIAMAGDEVVMSPHAQMLIHNAHGAVMGEADDLRDVADKLDKVSDNIASVYVNKAGGTIKEWRAVMKAVTLFSDAEAVEAGLADRIDGEREGVANRAGARAHTPAGRPSATILNQLGRLGRLLDDLIESKSEPRADVIARMATAADISESTVNQILRGEIECPPLDRLAGFARALDVSEQRLRTAGEADGCNYDATENILRALQKGTGDIVRKEPMLPDFDFAKEVKEAVAV